MTHRVLRTALVGLLVSVTAAQGAFSQESGQDSDRAFQRYEIEKVDPWGPFVLNFLLNFGIGSFVQGDTTGGLIVAGGQVIGIGMVVVDLGRKQEVDAYGFAVPNTPTALTWVGIGLASAASIAGYIFPFTYANEANEKLRRDLGISVADVSLSDQGLAVTFAVASASPGSN